MTSIGQKMRSSYQQLYILYSAVVLASVLSSIIFQSFVPLIIPPVVLIAYIAIVDVQKIYWLFFLLIPFSMEISLPNGLGTDLPAEPLMIGLSLIATLIFLYHLPKVESKWIKHPISILMILHLIWIGLSTLFSNNAVVSFKFLLAKIWYVVPFYFLSLYLIRNKTLIPKILDAVFFSLLFAIGFVMISHALTGFSFDSINQAVSPVFRNHVNYACLLVLLLPYLWFRIKHIEGAWKRRLFIAFGLLVLIAIYLSFTRAAYVAIVIAIVSYLIIKRRLLKLCLFSALMVMMVSISFLLTNDRYLQYAPEYERAIAHTKFDNLLEATTKMEDISTVERFYRWLSGVQMIKDKPLLGFGPGNFYFFYKEYAISGFKTYVSNNKEKSGIHNYYLMTTVEQGVLGGLIFLGLCITTLLVGERAYHQLDTAYSKDLVMAALLSFIIICAILIINDMVEAAKVGPFFFLAMAIIVRCDIVKNDKIFTK